MLLYIYIFIFIFKEKEFKEKKLIYVHKRENSTNCFLLIVSPSQSRLLKNMQFNQTFQCTRIICGD